MENLINKIKEEIEKIDSKTKIFYFFIFVEYDSEREKVKVPKNRGVVLFKIKKNKKNICVLPKTKFIKKNISLASLKIDLNKIIDLKE